MINATISSLIKVLLTANKLNAWTASCDGLIYNDKNSNELMLNEAHMFFKNMNIDALIAKNLYNSFKDYNFFRNMWE